MSIHVEITDCKLVAPPELRFTATGKAVANIRVVDNRRKKDDSGNWVNASATFLTCIAWEQMAERIAEDLGQGDLVNLTGTLEQRDYQTKEGEKRSAYEITLSSIGKSLRWLDRDRKPAKPAASYEDE